MTREELTSARVTLDDAPACITGFRNDYATVRALVSGIGFEWSWDAVERIVANGGRFRS